MAKFKYALFFDFHTLASIPDTGAAFDAEKFADQVQSCGVDFLTCHARCNQGNAYYDTKIGRRHPSLRFDMVRSLCDACAERGIRLSLYFNGHLSEEETLAHPEWADVPLTPRTRRESPFYHQVCYNSGFAEHLRDMALELIDGGYVFDGFFFDCLGASDCVCPRCSAEMKRRGIDFTSPAEVRKFSAFSADRMCRMLAGAIRTAKPDSLLFFNGRPFEEVGEMESHMECECLPTAGWGYDCLPSLAHYLPVLARPDQGILNMTGRFYNWGDFGGLRAEASLEFDLFYGLSFGMRPDIGGHMHPRGDMDLPVFDRIRSVYCTLRQYDEWHIDAVTDNETALVHQRAPMDYIPSGKSTAAAVRMLDELKVQFDFVSEAVPWDKYKLLIFPDDVVFTESIAERVRKHLKKGGKILASARSGLNACGTGFACLEWPVEYKAPTSHDPLYFQPAGELGKNLPDMPLSVYASGTEVKAARDASVEMFCVKPYFNYGWDGLHGNRYTPPEKITEEPFIVEKNGIIYVAGEIFAGYGSRGAKQLLDLLKNILDRLMPEPKLKTSGLPSFVRAVMQHKPDCDLVNLMAWCPEKRCNAVVVDDRIDVISSGIEVRMDGREVEKVCLAPDCKELTFESKAGYCSVAVPPFSGYCMIVIQYRKPEIMPSRE